MTHLRTAMFSAAISTALLSLACSPSEPPSAVESPASDVSEGVTFEPAYPSDVSSAELTAEDTEQQALHPPHGDGDAHAHDDDSHSHDSAHDSEEDADDEDHGHEH